MERYGKVCARLHISPVVCVVVRVLALVYALHRRLGNMSWMWGSSWSAGKGCCCCRLPCRMILRFFSPPGDSLPLPAHRHQHYIFFLSSSLKHYDWRIPAEMRLIWGHFLPGAAGEIWIMIGAFFAFNAPQEIIITKYRGGICVEGASGESAGFGMYCWWKEKGDLLRIKENGGGKCSLRHCVSSVARFYHISTGLSRRLRTSYRRSCSSRRWATSGEWFLCKEMPWRTSPLVCQTSIGGGGYCVYRSAASLRNNSLQYSLVPLLLQIFPGWMMGSNSDAAVVFCVRARTRMYPVWRFVSRTAKMYRLD